MIEIVQAGLLTSLQDAGRRRLRHLGIPWSGTLVPHWMQLANALVLNTGEHPVLECFEGGLILQVEDGPVRIAVAGHARLERTRAGATISLDCWRSHRLIAGDQLKLISTGEERMAIMAIGGLQVTPHLGSCSTYAKAGLGGLDGSALTSGQRLSVKPEYKDTSPQLQCAPFVDDAGMDDTGMDDTVVDDSGFAEDNTPSQALRVTLGPQADAFSSRQIESFLGSHWTLTHESDRMGARLQGPALQHIDAAHRDIVSDALLPGSIQVPGNGQPIVMLADAHTAGGYPKIATVISSDLHWLGRLRAGSLLRFEAVTPEQAIDITRQRHAMLARHCKSLQRVRSDAIDPTCLWENNLIDGVTDGQTDLHPGTTNTCESI